MSEKLIAGRAATEAILQAHKWQANHDLGQNFLIDAAAAQQIAALAAAEPQACLFEIGPGLGAISQLLAKKELPTALVELDKRFCRHLEQFFAENDLVHVINADALTFDYAAFMQQQGREKCCIVGNLPYYITSPLIRCFLPLPWHKMCLMMQKEVAKKLTANRKESSPLALMIDYYAVSRYEFELPPGCFLPAPAVDSAVITLTRREELPDVPQQPLFALIEAAFSQRRKTLPNVLNGYLGKDKAFWQEKLIGAGLAANVRAEQLKLDDFCRIWQQLEA
ncbi:MAG: ribosomal RNA small subunit methyltransferase A [Firmicutes bacterium]|nr:ribosomal RNA small subunit methyltransferase A [Bacillota bacterium]